MILDNSMSILGPFVVLVNLMIMFYCQRPKSRFGMPFTLSMLAGCAAVVHILTLIVEKVDMTLLRFCGILFLPVMLWLFRGAVFQKVFAFFFLYQLTALPTHLAEALIAYFIGSQSPYAPVAYFVLSLLMLGIYMAVMLRFGRQFFARMFAGGQRGEWALYSFGAVFSFFLILTVSWTTIGVGMYIVLMLFILWSLLVLCFTIIRTHEKAAQAYQAETLLLQMNTMREQTDTEKKYRNNMEILRHDMRHEMGTVMELFRTGKDTEAEKVYDEWQSHLSGTIPAALCPEPVLNAVFSRFERRAADQNIRLYVKSDIPDTLPIDTIRLSVIVSNALENALNATDKVTEQSQRSIRVKLIQNGAQIGLEIINPCTAPVEFDGRGFPVTHETGHGIGVRSIAAFAKDNGYLLDFSCSEGEFMMRLVMGVAD